MKLSITFPVALVALLASPVMATAIATATAELTTKTEESSSSTTLYDLFSSIVVSPKVEVHEESPSADANFGKKKDKKTKGKVTETYATVYMVMDADSDEPDTFAQAFIQDALLYTYNAVQEGSDLQGIGSHLLGTVKSPDGPDGDALFPELSKSLRGSVSWRRSVYRG
jgi:uncharacterized protein Veg